MNDEENVTTAAGTGTAPLSLGYVTETVCLADLEYDRENYQRGVEAHHKKLARNWNPALAGKLIVARRAGPPRRLLCVDGQQRAHAMILCGVTHWQADVIESSGPRYEAQLFRQINGPGGRKALTPAQLFRAALAADDPVAVACARAVQQVGFTLIFKQRSALEQLPGRVGCVSTLYRCCKGHGEEVLFDALHCIAACWPDVAEATKDYVIAGLCMLVDANRDRFSEARFVRQLCRVSPRSILLNVAPGMIMNNRASATAQYLLRLYNKGLRGASSGRLVLVAGRGDHRDGGGEDDAA